MSKIVLKKEDSIEKQRKKLYKAVEKKTGVNTKKFSGILEVREDPLKYQKCIRKEWDETTY
ncbi:MAG: hypothetical protein JJ966_05470 [Balneolaceae bacterium]|nr:hypothetical protein [Balneolaceae bacterium]